MSLFFLSRLKTLGSNSTLAIALPLADNNEDPAANTDAARTGLYGRRSLGNDGIVFVVDGTDVLDIRPTNAYIAGNAVWHAGNFDKTLYQLLSDRNANNGYSGLDSGGKVAYAQLPTRLSTAQSFKGGWDATANSPALSSGVGTTGDTYRVSTSGSTALDGIASWSVNDQAYFDGTYWRKLANTAGTDFVTTTTALNGINATVVDTFAHGTSNSVKYDVVVSDGSSISQLHTILAARVGGTYTTDITSAVNGGGSQTITVTVSGSNTLLTIQSPDSGLTAKVRRYTPL
jgi:hypothetical protein